MHWKAAPLLVLIGLSAQVVSVEATSQTIEWELMNPHRLFLDAGEFRRMRPSPDQTMDEWYDAKLAGRVPAWPERTNFVEATGTYDAAYSFPMAYPIRARLRPRRSGVSCVWTLDSESMERDCAEDVEFETARPGTVLRVTPGEGERLQTRVSIEDLLVVGLGDSYASGEGNPDRPTVWRTSEAKPRTGPRWYRRYRIAPERGERNADWHDDRCHRSLYSYQHLVTLWLAAANPHRAVTFVSFSCSGAEIFDGMLEPQSDPPGGRKVKLSQLQALRRELCEPGEDRLVNCREVDIMMVSIGGNDSFFAPMATRVIAPDRSYLAPFTPLYRGLFRILTSWREPHEATTYIERDLPAAYSQLFQEISNSVRFSDDARLLLTAYPNPLRREDGTKCAHGTEYSENVSRLSMFEALKHVLPLPGFITDRWQFNLTSQESADPRYWGEIEVLENNVMTGLQRTMAGAVAATAGSAHPWELIDGFREEALAHGMCAVSRENQGDSARELGWTYPDSSGSWTLQPPEAWQPYERRARWFRTANDTYLTQTGDHGAATGMLHPTAELHAAVARSVLAALSHHDSPGPDSP